MTQKSARPKRMTFIPLTAARLMAWRAENKENVERWTAILMGEFYFSKELAQDTAVNALQIDCDLLPAIYADSADRMLLLPEASGFYDYQFPLSLAYKLKRRKAFRAYLCDNPGRFPANFLHEMLRDDGIEKEKLPFFVDTLACLSRRTPFDWLHDIMKAAAYRNSENAASFLYCACSYLKNNFSNELIASVDELPSDNEDDEQYRLFWEKTLKRVLRDKVCYIETLATARKECFALHARRKPRSILYRSMLPICFALVSLDLTALETVLILDNAVEDAESVIMHDKFEAAALVKRAWRRKMRIQ